MMPSQGGRIASAAHASVQRELEHLRLAEVRLARSSAKRGVRRVRMAMTVRFVQRRSAVGDHVTPSAIAAHLGVGASTVSRLLALMEARGIVATEPEAGDRRRKVVSIVDEGVLPVEGIGMDLVGEALSTMSIQRAAVVRDGLRRIASALDQEGLQEPCAEASR